MSNSKNYGIVNEGQMSGQFSISTNIGSGTQNVTTAQTTEQSIDLKALASELESLRHAAREEPESLEKDKNIGLLAGAQEAAHNGDEASVMSILKMVGKWGLSVAERTGLPLVIQAIKASLGL